MNKTVINTFTEGMNKDVSKQMMSDKAYLDANNVRLITTEGGTTGSLENIKGNILLPRGEADAQIKPGQRIIGSCEIRDKIILFTTNNQETIPSGGNSMIYVLGVDLETETQDYLEVLYDDAWSTDESTLNFSNYHPIKAVARYETPNIQKVYWTDGFNNVRYMNVANYLTVTGTIHEDSTYDYIGVDKFEFLPKFMPMAPQFNNMTTGTLMSGMVQYAYQLYILNGAETAISPVGGLIHIVTDSDFKANSRFYKGDPTSVQTGKGVQSYVYNDSIGYNRLRLIRVHYASLDAIPTISIVTEIEISPLGAENIVVTDTGTSLRDMTIDEFNIYSTELFKAQDLTIKDNRLFAANIEKSDFNIDEYDSRAVRYNNSDGIWASVKDEGGNNEVVISQPATDSLIDWNDAGWYNYISTHDGMNEFNNPDNDLNVNYRYIYQSNGSTVGAEGPNIAIDFQTEGFALDSAGSSIQGQKTFYQEAGGGDSYSLFANPYYDGYRSWQRDEVYRLFIVFGNDRGQKSDPKWIIDLRMPSLHDYDFMNADSADVFPGELVYRSDSDTIIANLLYPRIKIKNFPAGATWAQVYRCKREKGDRSILTQAFGIHSVTLAGYDVADAYQSFTDTYQPKYVGGPDFEHTTNGNLIKLISPEINILKNIGTNTGNDSLEWVTSYDYPDSVYYNSYVSNGGTWIIRTHKCLANTITSLSSQHRTAVNEAAFARPTESISDGTVSISGPDSLDFTKINNKFYCNYSVINRPGAGGPYESYKLGCSGLVVDFDTTDWLAQDKGYPIINYRQTVTWSRYGGITYEARAMNESIPCSYVIGSGMIGSYNTIQRGDTFINFFDASTLLYDLKAGIWDRQTMSESIFVPLESSVNCDLRFDQSQSHIANNKFECALRQESAGAHEYNNIIYTQEEDLYSYNTVYSQDTAVQTAISNPIDVNLETTFDCMIKASNVKTNGEFSDSWTKFGINEFIEVETKYGPINGIYTFNNALYYWQDKAFGAVSVNERSIVQDENSAQIVLGTGGVLDRYDYISNHVGCQDKFSITSSNNGMYWFDRLVKSIYRFSNGLSNLTRSKYLQSYMDNNDDLDSGCASIAHANTNDNEVLFTFIKPSNGAGFTISFSELADSFVSFYGFTPSIYIPYKHRYLTTTYPSYSPSGFVENNLIFLHESNIAERCNFYSLNAEDPGFQSSTIEILFNPEFVSTKVFDNMFMSTNAFSNQTELFADTFNTVQFYNDYQNTGLIDLVPTSNIERRERGWTLVVPRNIVSSGVSSNPDKFISVDSTQLFKERMRDKYLIAYLMYYNTTGSTKFVINHVGLKYRTSIR